MKVVRRGCKWYVEKIFPDALRAGISCRDLRRNGENGITLL